MAKLSYKVSYYALYVMFAIILVVLGMFFFGGDAQGDAVLASVDAEMWQPAHTDALIYLMYILFFVAIIATVVGVILLVIVMIVAWSMGNGEPMVIPGYSGTENVPFWLKLTDMFLYTIYFLLGATVLAMLFSSVKKKLS